MKPSFKEKKTTQATAVLLKLQKGKMNYMQLIKLLYLADRTALIRWGRPITFDTFVSMNKGPVLSRTLNLINEAAEPGEKSFWRDHISAPRDYDVQLIEEPGDSELSEAETNLLEQVFTQFGKMDKWDLVNQVMHRLPEWKYPSGSSIPIEYLDILRVAGKTEIESQSIKEDLENLALAEMMLGQA